MTCNYPQPVILHCRLQIVVDLFHRESASSVEYIFIAFIISPQARIAVICLTTKVVTPSRLSAYTAPATLGADVSTSMRDDICLKLSSCSFEALVPTCDSRHGWNVLYLCMGSYVFSGYTLRRANRLSLGLSWLYRE